MGGGWDGAPRGGGGGPLGIGCRRPGTCRSGCTHLSPRQGSSECADHENGRRRHRERAGPSTVAWRGTSGYGHHQETRRCGKVRRKDDRKQRHSPGPNWALRKRRRSREPLHRLARELGCIQIKCSMPTCLRLLPEGPLPGRYAPCLIPSCSTTRRVEGWWCPPMAALLSGLQQLLPTLSSQTPVRIR